MVQITPAPKICGIKVHVFVQSTTVSLDFGVPSKEVQDDCSVC